MLIDETEMGFAVQEQAAEGTLSIYKYPKMARLVTIYLSNGQRVVLASEEIPFWTHSQIVGGEDAQAWATRTIDRFEARRRAIAFIPQMVTVPSCEPCQRVKGLGDRDLWIRVTLDIGNNHPHLPLHVKRIVESNERTQHWIKRSLDNANEVDLVTDAGLVVGKAIEFEFNPDWVLTTMKMIVRGLHFEETKTILDPTCYVDAQHIPWNAAPTFLLGLSSKTRIDPIVKGRMVAWWASLPVGG